MVTGVTGGLIILKRFCFPLNCHFIYFSIYWHFRNGEMRQKNSNVSSLPILQLFQPSLKFSALKYHTHLPLSFFLGLLHKVLGENIAGVGETELPYLWQQCDVIAEECVRIVMDFWGFGLPWVNPWCDWHREGAPRGSGNTEESPRGHWAGSNDAYRQIPLVDCSPWKLECT